MSNAYNFERLITFAIIGPIRPTYSFAYNCNTPSLQACSVILQPFSCLIRSTTTLKDIIPGMLSRISLSMISAGQSVLKRDRYNQSRQFDRTGRSLKGISALGFIGTTPITI